MSHWLFELSALDPDENAKTLYFSDAGFVSDGHYYDARIAKAPIMQVSPVSGGLLPHIFSNSGGSGDVELANIDGGLDYLDDYAIDGRSAVVKFVDNDGTIVELFVGVAIAVSDNNGIKRIGLAPLSENLKKDHPMSVFAGNNVLPSGLEGTSSDLKDAVKPKVFGDVRNIPAKLVNESLLIYQVSSLADCVVTAVYDDGVRLVNYRVNGLHPAGATVIAVSGGLGTIKSGDIVVFANHSDTLYVVASGLSGGNIVLSAPLEQGVAGGVPIDQVDYYASSSDLQATNYLVNGAHAAGAKVIAVDSGIGLINAGDLVVFGSQSAAYLVQSSLASGVITLESGLDQPLSGGEQVIIVGEEMPAHWTSYNGYFRLAMPPAGLVTCDARTSETSAGDVFAMIADESGFNVDAGSVDLLNSVGIVGVYADQKTTTSALLDKIVSGCGAYYYFIGTTLYAGLIEAPDVSEEAVFYDYQIISLDRAALGTGSNGVPHQSVAIKYDRIEVTQTTTAGSANSSFKERLKSQFRSYVNSVVSPHLLAESLSIESVLRNRSDAVALSSRLLSLCGIRRDFLTASIVVNEIGSITIGQTVKIVSSRLGYLSGRRLVVVGFELNAKKKIYDLRMLG